MCNFSSARKTTEMGRDNGAAASAKPSFCFETRGSGINRPRLARGTSHSFSAQKDGENRLTSRHRHFPDAFPRFRGRDRELRPSEQTRKTGLGQGPDPVL